MGEMLKQVDIIYSSVAIAFARYWRWGPLRIRRLFDVTQAAWDECGATNDRSMLQMLEDETGIDLKMAEYPDKSRHDVAYLTTEIAMDPRRMTRPQWIYMRQQQKKWIGAQLLACMLLVLHRKYGSGEERMVRLLEQINDIRDEFSWNRKALIKACKEEAGVELKEGD